VGARQVARPDAVMTVAPAWIEAHCVIPDGFRRGEPLRLYDYQLRFFSAFYTVKGTAVWVPEDPTLGPAFRYRRGILIGPQKLGKGPQEAAHTCLEGAGPALFAGWAGDDDGYVCAEHGCGCGWEYPYEPGEPMGMPWPTPLIQITAVSEEQTDNIYAALRPMIELGPLSDVIPRTGEEFIRLPGGGRIDTVTSSAQSRLGQRVTFVVQDEVGLWTPQNKMTKVADTQYRNAAGMGGRAALTSNAWDPSENSVAQREMESSAQDVYRQYDTAPVSLSYRNKAERRRIHQIVYGDTLRSRGGHIDLDAIEAEAADLLERDPAQAERFFGNRIVHGAGAFLSEELLAARTVVREPDRRICLGFDGSSSGDWTAIRAEDVTGLRFTPTYDVGGDERPTWWNPAQHGGRIPRSEVRAAVASIFARHDVARMYCDPRDWQTEIDEWALTYGEKVVVQWPTNQIGRMFDGLNRYRTDVAEGATEHLEDPVYRVHALNARMLAKPGDKFILGKPSDHQKIDVLMADVLAHEAAADARAEGWTADADARMFVFR
jgi:hypothetical protein